MRDVLIYNLSRTIGMWAPRTQFIELFVVEDGQAPQATLPVEGTKGHCRGYLGTLSWVLRGTVHRRFRLVYTLVHARRSPSRPAAPVAVAHWARAAVLRRVRLHAVPDAITSTLIVIASTTHVIKYWCPHFDRQSPYCAGRIQYPLHYKGVYVLMEKIDTGVDKVRAPHSRTVPAA